MYCVQNSEQFFRQETISQGSASYIKTSAKYYKYVLILANITVKKKSYFLVMF